MKGEGQIVLSPLPVPEIGLDAMLEYNSLPKAIHLQFALSPSPQSTRWLTGNSHLQFALSPTVVHKLLNDLH